MDRPDFAVPQCYGRRQEVGTILAAYNRIRDSSEACRSEVVLIGGASGTGKSTLAQTLREPVSEDGGYFISGKFDERRSEPYSAFIAAFSEFCDIVGAKGCSEIDRVRATIANALGSEAVVLTDLVPSLERVTGKQTPVRRRSSLKATIVGKEAVARRRSSAEQQAPFLIQGISTERSGSIETANRFNFISREFISAISRPPHALVLFLDDLQWSDESSLDLVHSLVSDVNSTRVLFVLAFRDEEAEGSGLLGNILGKIRNTGITTIQIKVSNLESDAVNDLISDKLELSPESTESLTSIVCQKTKGNALFVVQYLKFLVETDCLLFDANDARWIWDMEQIQYNDAGDDVVDLNISKMQRLPEQSQYALMIAACIGADVDDRLLKAAFASSIISPKDESEDKEFSVKAMEILPRVVQEGLLIAIPEHGSYRFAHDRIQQAAYSLIPRKERRSFHLTLGRSLWNRSSAEELEEWLFIIVNQIKRGLRLVTDKVEQVELAELCLRAGEKAVLSSAFASATTYLSTGVELLDEGDWKNNYQLCYALFNTAAEAEYCNGNFESVDRYLQQSFHHVSAFRERIPFIIINMMSLGAQGQVQEATDAGFDALRELGERFPTRPSKFRFGVELYKTRRKLRRKSNASLLRLPTMENVDKLAAMQILNLLTMYSYIGRPEAAPFVVIRIVQLSLRYGVCAVSSFGFACYGVILCGALGHVDEGCRFGQLALSLLEKLEAKEWMARVYSTVYSVIDPWRRHINAAIEPLKYGSRVGLETGDIEFSMMNLHFLCIRLFLCGRPLGEVEEVTRKTCGQMAQYGQDTLLKLTVPFWQFLLNLMGRSENPLILTGEVMDQKEMLKNSTETILDTDTLTICYFRMVIAFFLGDFDLAAEMGAKSRRVDTISSAVFEHCTHSFYYGLTALSLATISRLRKWRAIGRMVLKKMEQWARYAPQNCLHRVYLLKADFAALERKHGKAMTLYNQASEQAAKEGFAHEQALSLERAGMYELECCNPTKAAELIKRSLIIYSRWGAKAKVHQLEKKYEFLME